MVAMDASKSYIAVMGVTGAGKSTFIKTATGANVEIGTTMTSCTTQVKPFFLECAGQNVVLIDTPGFNDTFREEAAILKDIAVWLETMFREPLQIKLTGIVYMQAITDRRMYGSTLRNLKMFKELCGDNPMKNVVLVTTGWGTARLSNNYGKAEDSENELQQLPEFWKPLIERGARVARFEDTPDSALSIIASLLDREPQTLQIQQELVIEDQTLVNTSAGRVVNEEMKKLEDKYARELADVQEEMREAIAAKDVELQEALAVTRQQMQKLRDDARRAQDELQYSRRNEARAAEGLRSEFRELRQSMERTRAEQEEQHAAELERSRTEQRKELEELAVKMKAEQMEQQLKFEGIVQQLRRNEKKLRREERAILEARIAELENRPVEKEKGTGSQLLEILFKCLGSVAMAALGFNFF